MNSVVCREKFNNFLKADFNAGLTKVQLVSITKNYGNLEVLKNINLTVEDKELFVVIGPSGSGKSTLLRVIAGLEYPDSGKVLFDGVDVTAIPANKRGIGMIFQDYAVWPHMSVEDNIKFVVKDKDPDSVVTRVLETVGLLHKRKSMPSQLSGGELQRVAIARALAVNPKILLLDEPLSNLDEKIRKELLVELVNIIKENRLTAIFVTHSQEEAFEIGDRIAVINKGVIEQVGSPSDLIENPATVFVASFIGDNLVLEGVLKQVQGNSYLVSFEGFGNLTVMPKNQPSVRPGDRVVFVYRKDRLLVSGEAAGEGWVECKLIEKKNVGYSVKYYIEAPNNIKLAVAAQNGAAFQDKIFIKFAPSSGYLYKA